MERGYQSDISNGFRSSSGHVLSDAAWLDVHFQACRPEYIAMLRSVGIRPGWRVLDVGCGTGSFIPELATLVGSTGSVAACDVDPQHIASINGRLNEWQVGCPLSTAVGPFTELPFSENEFDAAWCANVLQYLDDDELTSALAELRRVVRPGGLVAVKDVDMLLAQVRPGDPFMLPSLAQACATGPGAAPQSRGSVRGRELRRLLERAGLVDVWQRTTLIERWAPLRPLERQLWDDWLAHLAQASLGEDLPESHRAAWKQLAEPSGRSRLLNDPELYLCEGQIVAAGENV